MILKLARASAIVLLSFNATAAIYGGSSLILYPDGSNIHLDPALLAHTPFHNYLIPGIILLLFNGLSSVLALIVTLAKRPNHSLFIAGQGLVLLGWLIIQILLIRKIDNLHYIMGFAGAALIGCGIVIGNNAYSI